MSAPAGDRTPADRTHSPLYGILIGLTTLGVLLQGLWAGLFLRERGGWVDRWVGVHALDGQVTTALALVAAVVAFVQLRERRDLVLGTAVLTVALALEVGLGSAAGDSTAARAVHVPLALLIMGLAVSLPLRARAPRP
jgi:nitrate/nitrite transporter NarK